MSKRAEEAWAVYEYREHPKGLYYTCYVDGYKQAEKDTIERACAWWERNLRYIISTPNVRETYLRDFKNDMEEEQ